MDGWNTSLSYWVSAYFQGQTVSFREGNPCRFVVQRKKNWIWITPGPCWIPFWEDLGDQKITGEKNNWVGIPTWRIIPLNK